MEEVTREGAEEEETGALARIPENSCICHRREGTYKSHHKTSRKVVSVGTKKGGELNYVSCFDVGCSKQDSAHEACVLQSG